MLAGRGFRNLVSCPDCAGEFVFLNFGGCGGRGKMVGCEKCDQIYIQVSGGIFATPGGEYWKKLEFTLSEYRSRPAK